jgi:AcrR family transcriptional regulator
MTTGIDAVAEFSTSKDSEAPLPRHATKARILAETVRIIDEHGEAAVRIHDIQAACEVTAPSIYHFFGNREGLVIEAQAERLLRALNEYDPVVDMQLTAVASKEELRTVLRSFLDMFWHPERTAVRARRLSALGSAIGRPELTDLFARVIGDYVAVMCQRLVPFQNKGWIRADLDLSVFNYWLMGLILGRVYIEFGGNTGPFPEWNAMTQQAVEFTLFGPEQGEQAGAV